MMREAKQHRYSERLQLSQLVLLHIIQKVLLSEKPVVSYTCMYENSYKNSARFYFLLEFKVFSRKFYGYCYCLCDLARLLHLTCTE